MAHRPFCVRHQIPTERCVKGKRVLVVDSIFSNPDKCYVSTRHGARQGDYGAGWRSRDSNDVGVVQSAADVHRCLPVPGSGGHVGERAAARGHDRAPFEPLDLLHGLPRGLYGDGESSVGDTFARQGDGGVHASAQAEHEVEGGLLLDVVVRQGAAVLELLAREDQALLVGGDALLVLDLGLDVINRVARLNVEGDGFARERLDENLHAVRACARREVVVVGLFFFNRIILF